MYLFLCVLTDSDLLILSSTPSGVVSPAFRFFPPIFRSRIADACSEQTVTTGVDQSYLPHYLDLALNWKTIDGEMIDLFQGITMVRSLSS